MRKNYIHRFLGTLVYQINVTNRDSNDVLTYTLPGGHEYFEFRNSSNRGIITIKRQVDREVREIASPYLFVLLIIACV